MYENWFFLLNIMFLKCIHVYVYGWVTRYSETSSCKIPILLMNDLHWDFRHLQSGVDRLRGWGSEGGAQVAQSVGPGFLSTCASARDWLSSLITWRPVSSSGGQSGSCNAFYSLALNSSHILLLLPYSVSYIGLVMVQYDGGLQAGHESWGLWTIGGHLGGWLL